MRRLILLREVLQFSVLADTDVYEFRDCSNSSNFLPYMLTLNLNQLYRFTPFVYTLYSVVQQFLLVAKTFTRD